MTLPTTHTHVIGGSRKGKSKYLELDIRKKIDEGQGFAVLDWHGPLYRDVVNYLAYVQPDREIYLLNPSRPDYVVGFNPFMNRGLDISVQVNRRIDATIKPWGIPDTNQMPTFEKICRMLYTFAVEGNEPLQHAALLLRYPKKELRQYAISVISDTYIKQQWKEFQYIKSLREWREQILSTDNRLGRFLGSKSVRRFMGLQSGNIDIGKIVDRGAIVAVNLGASEYLDRDSARVFASLAIYEFFEAMMARALDPTRFTLYLDEFQEYITDDIAAMLDQVLKSGLDVVLAHQHLGHLLDHPELKESIFTNARNRVIFGGTTYPTACELVNQDLLSVVNRRQIKETYFHTVTKHREETRRVESDGEGESDGSSSLASETAFEQSSSATQAAGSVSGSSRFHGTSVVPFLMPYYEKEKTNDAEWSREEKVSRAAEILMSLPQRHCFVKMDGEPARRFVVPEVEEYGLFPETVLEYEQSLYRSAHALSADRADALLLEAEREFVQKARHEEEFGSEGKKPTRRR